MTQPSVAQDIAIRPILDSDWATVAEIVNFYEKDGLTGDLMLARSNRWTEGDPRLQIVATDESGRVVGHGRSLRRASDPAGKFSTIVYTHPERVGQGIGRRLYAEIESFAVEHGAEYLISYIIEQCPRGITFGELNGYVANQHLFESWLDVQAFDTGPYLAAKPSLEATGYRFLTLSEAGDTPENRRRLYELDVATDHDTPGFENWGVRTFEQYTRDEHESFGFTGDGVFVAEFGGEWVAMSAVRPRPVERQMHTDYTGVRREHRGKGLAQVLKALAVDYAKSRGIERLITNNDERNAPMLAINRKMGFNAEPGFYVYRKELLERREG